MLPDAEPDPGDPMTPKMKREALYRMQVARAATARKAKAAKEAQARTAKVLNGDLNLLGRADALDVKANLLQREAIALRDCHRAIQRLQPKE